MFKFGTMAANLSPQTICSSTCSARMKNMNGMLQLFIGITMVFLAVAVIQRVLDIHIYLLLYLNGLSSTCQTIFALKTQDTFRIDYCYMKTTTMNNYKP